MEKNIIDVLARRASVRAYDKERPLPQGVIEKLLTAAMQAPTTGNMQLYSVIITDSTDGKERLKQLHFGQPMAADCAALLTFCADVHRFGRWCAARKAQSGLDNGGGMLMAMEDAVIFAQQFVTLAEAEGLGTCYLGTVPYNIEAFAKELNLPSGVMPLFSVAVGYPAGERPAPSDRLPLEAVMHHEKYRRPAADDIDAWYSAKEALPESVRFIAENGKETLAQVYADVRYPRAQNEKIAADLVPFFFC